MKEAEGRAGPQKEREKDYVRQQGVAWHSSPGLTTCQQHDPWRGSNFTKPQLSHL